MNDFIDNLLKEIHEENLKKKVEAEKILESVQNKSLWNRLKGVFR